MAIDCKGGTYMNTKREDASARARKKERETI